MSSDDRDTQPLVSVVMPFYYNFDTVGEAAKSVCELDYPADKLELLLVNDATQGGADYLRRLPEVERAPLSITVIDLSSNQGIGGARNAGQKRAAGEYLFFLDADDRILPNKLSLQVPVLAQSGADAVFSDYQVKKEYGIEKVDIGHRTRVFEDARHQFLAWSQQISSFLFRKDALDAVGGHRRMPAEDKDLYFRLLFSGYSFVYAPGVVFQYQPQPNSYTSDELAYLNRTRKRNFHLLAYNYLKKQGELKDSYKKIISRKLLLEAQQWARYGEWGMAKDRYKRSASINKLRPNRKWVYMISFYCLGFIATEYLIYKAKRILLKS